ncbi:MAG: protein kinase [Pirellulaceae bacterium]
MRASQYHPTNEELTAFGLGKLDDSAAEPISRHLQACDPCLATLAGLEGDTFIDLVERADRVELPTADPNLIPRELANHPRYLTVELIGRGGMGDVYRAEHRLMNRTVALKVVNRKLVANKVAVERFRREVRAAAMLSHPNIVTSHDAEQIGDLHFLVMEFVVGTDLAKVVQKLGSATARTRLRLGFASRPWIAARSRLWHGSSRYQATQLDGDSRWSSQDSRFRLGYDRLGRGQDLVM